METRKAIRILYFLIFFIAFFVNKTYATTNLNTEKNLKVEFQKEKACGIVL